MKVDKNKSGNPEQYKKQMKTTVRIFTEELEK